MDYIEKLKTIEARTWAEYLANLQANGGTERDAENWLESTLAYVQGYTTAEDLEILREQYAEDLSGTSEPDELGDSEITCAEYALTIALIDIIADDIRRQS